jgi:hypothetical protein
MALEDFLGRTPDIRIIDFLATNYHNSYNQSEISEFTGISRNILYKKLPEMVNRKLLEIDNSVGRFKSYRLARNSVVNKLVAMDIEYNLMISDSVDQNRSTGENNLENPETPMENRYYQAPETSIGTPGDYKIPISLEINGIKDSGGLLMLSGPAAKKLYLSLKEAIEPAG